MRTLSLDTARALLAGDDDDRRRLEGAVARAMDPPWELQPPRATHGRHWTRWTPPAGVQVNPGTRPPAYLSDDPRLNAEMEKALFATGRSVGVYHHSDEIVVPGHVWEVYTTPVLRPCNAFGDTKAEALVLALAAAGLLKEDDHEHQG